MNNLKALTGIINKLFYILDSNQKKQSVMVFFSMILVSVLELLSVSVIYPFLEIVLEPENIKEVWYLNWIYDILPNITSQQVLIFVGCCIILVFLAKNGFAIIAAYIQSRFAAGLQKDLSVTMLETYLKRPYQFFLNTNSSILIRGINSDVNAVYNVLLNVFQMVGELLTILMVGLFLIKTDCFMAIGSMIFALLAFFSIVMGFKNKMKAAGELSRLAEAEKYKYSQQAIMGIKEISVMDRRENFIAQFKGAAEKTEKAMLVNNVISACPDRILEGVCISGIILIVCIRIRMGVGMETFVPILGVYAMGAFRILPSIAKVSAKINSIIYFMPGLQSSYDNIKFNREAKTDKSDYSITAENIETSNICFRHSLEITNMQWKYSNMSVNVLDDLNMTIKKGESVAFIGESGAGKTTLADIILGLLPPQSGTVEMDGIDIFSIPHDWAKIIGYVPQSVFLVDDTVRNNVAFGVREEDISDEKVWDALEQAQLKPFIQSLPNGLDTIVGERGVKFSGGQRQRVAIARALYENPDILVLDEATAALDNETESAVMEAIDALQGSKTLVIVAHRLSTIRNCDKIYEIKDGVARLCSKDEIFGA